MIESPLIAGLLSQAEARMLLRAIQKRYQELPEEVAEPIRACRDSAQLERWLDVVLEVDTLAEFRLRTGL